MKTKMIYGFSYYGWDGCEEGREYFLSAKARNERMREISVKNCEPFKFVLNGKNVWRLNFHGMAKDKREIKNLKSKVEDLRKKLGSKIELLFHEA